MRAYLIFLALLGVAVWLLSGCATHCFEPVGVNPPKCSAMVFDGCRGRYEVRALDGCVAPTTTTTTLPKVGV